MTTLELHGRITEDGKLKIDLPAGLPAGDVTVRIDLPGSALDWEHQPWTEEELKDLIDLMEPEPKTGAEIVAWLQANPPDDPNWGGLTDNDDVADYIHDMRRTARLDWGQAE